MEETWKKVKGYPHYEVSTLGNVRTRKKIVKAANGKRIYPSHPVTINIYAKRPNFGIVDETGRVTIATLKRVVAATFIRNPKKYDRVLNIDGNEQNCAVDNLKWVSRDEYNKVMGTYTRVGRKKKEDLHHRPDPTKPRIFNGWQ